MKISRPEYPRPELVRKNWLNLNGKWDFEYDYGNGGVYDDKWKLFGGPEYKKAKHEVTFTKKINVPFCPESKLSGIGNTDFFDACWYRRTVKVPENWTGRVLLHFEACYYRSILFINGEYIGKHDGGYTPFTFDITDKVKAGEEFEIMLHAAGDARDYSQPSGKQSWQRDSHGCFYTRTTGIWQTVWLENVPEEYLVSYKTESDIANSTQYFKLTYSGIAHKTITAKISYNGKFLNRVTVESNSKLAYFSVKLKDAKLWNVGDPNLYDVEITSDYGEYKDVVKTYFGMREVSVEGNKFYINGKKVLQRLVLDQGYYPDGVYTAPTKEDLMNDINLSLKAGFNGARLHQKVFERNFLYDCDKTGYIVWGEYPNWGFGYDNEAYTNIYVREWLESVERDYNHPAIIGWCPMNENWDVENRRQSNGLVLSVYEATKRFDSTRPVIDVSWNYQVKTDVFDTHDYVQETEEFDKRFSSGAYDQYHQTYEGQPYFLSEYGGIAWVKDGKGWGYGNAPKTEEEFINRYISMSDSLHKNPDLCALCYTQLYDVEQEQNGLYNYDRTPKFSDEVMEKFRAAMAKKSAYED